MALEQDIASFLGTESAIIYSQAFSTISSVIPAFCKRGDIIVADRGVSFPVHKGIQVSRTTVRWYDHNDLNSLEEVLRSVERERLKKRLPVTRRFIVTEGIFENDGAMIDLPKVVRLFLVSLLVTLTSNLIPRLLSSIDTSSVYASMRAFPLVPLAEQAVGLQSYTTCRYAA
jgi:Aminotransferase class I and II